MQRRHRPRTNSNVLVKGEELVQGSQMPDFDFAVSAFSIAAVGMVPVKTQILHIQHSTFGIPCPSRLCLLLAMIVLAIPASAPRTHTFTHPLARAHTQSPSLSRLLEILFLEFAKMTSCVGKLAKI